LNEIPRTKICCPFGQYHWAELTSRHRKIGRRSSAPRICSWSIDLVRLALAPLSAALAPIDVDHQNSVKVISVKQEKRTES
jgi:hypothetical protein